MYYLKMYFLFFNRWTLQSSPLHQSCHTCVLYTRVRISLQHTVYTGSVCSVQYTSMEFKHSHSVCMMLGSVCSRTHLEGDTTSKQNLLSMSSQGLTEHSLRSSTTTVSESYRTNTLDEIPEFWRVTPTPAQLWNRCDKDTSTQSQTVTAKLVSLGTHVQLEQWWLNGQGCGLLIRSGRGSNAGTAKLTDLVKTQPGILSL